MGFFQKLFSFRKSGPEDVEFSILLSNKFDIVGTAKEVERIKDPLKRIYQTTEGRALLDSLSVEPKTKIIADFNEKGADACHSHHAIYLRSFYMSTIYHELIHEHQEQNNAVADCAVLPEDAFLFNAMSEMDATINTECGILRDFIEKDSTQLNVFKNDDKSDMGFLYHTFLSQKQTNPNLSDEEALLTAKGALAMRYLDQTKETKKQMDKLKLAHPDWSIEAIKDSILNNQDSDMSKSEKGHRRCIMNWFFAYEEEFNQQRNYALSGYPKTDRLVMFDYYKKRLNLSCHYDDIFNQFFDTKIRTEQIDENTKCILKDGKPVVRIQKTEKGKEVSFFHENSDKVKYKRLEKKDGRFVIDEFDRNCGKKIQEGEMLHGLFIKSARYYESGAVRSRSEYKNGELVNTVYYDEKRRKDSSVNNTISTVIGRSRMLR